MSFSTNPSVQWLTKLFCFRKEVSGVVSIEAAFILPVLATLMMLSYNYSSVLKQKAQGYYAFYSIGDSISARATSVTCEYLDRLTKLAYDSYAEGNWGRRDKTDWEWDQRGGEDFRVQVHGLQVLTADDPDYNAANPQARILWSFHRTANGIRVERDTIPGDLITIPEAYRLEGEFYVFVEGRHFMRAPISWDDNRQSYTRLYHTYFSPRLLPQVSLTGKEVYDRCERMDGEYL